MQHQVFFNVFSREQKVLGPMAVEGNTSNERTKL
jgi:hypothetical protein